MPSFQLHVGKLRKEGCNIIICLTDIFSRDINNYMVYNTIVRLRHVP